jgi:PAS domain S-box-containing protein
MSNPVKTAHSADDAIRLKAIIETAVDGIITINDSGEIETVNPATCQLFGYTEGELLGQNIALLMPSPYREKHDGYMHNYLSTGARKIIGIGREVPGKKKDGTIFPFWLAVSEFWIGERRLFTGIVHDMTEQRKAELALTKQNQELEQIVAERTEKLSDVINRLLASNQQLEHEIDERKMVAQALKETQTDIAKTERLLQQIVQNFPDGAISVVDRDFKVVFSGGELHRTFKMDSADLIGKRMYPLVSDEAWSVVEAQVAKVFEGENLIDFEIPEKVRDQYFVFDAAPLQEPDGSIPRIAVYTRAVTKLKRIEAELRESLKKERELGSMKSRFVSMASHEFRTPLSTILSSASLMTQYPHTEQQDKRERHFKKIKSAVDMLTTILNDFLSLSRLEEGMVVLNKEIFEIHEFCHETLEDIQSILKHGQVVKTQHTGGKQTVLMDKKLLKLILVNLLSNASKYSNEDSEILCAIDIDKNKLQIHITDTGIGIPEEEQKHLFDRFFRATNATNIKGTGLGLHIVKRYAELMDGTVSFKSTLGQGSTFTVSLKIQTEGL